ncbi:uncharacterized protein LOC135475733 [Liolophura sinensis]|uniref:uncharacterized protein LOC135475733 n=1 Tax=Liolophura sinensis TaxID=3198878 RepID=UPI003158401E
MSISYISRERFQLVRDEDAHRRAALAITKAQGLIIMAGAGLGADSGIPTYRTNEDFWIAHPELKDIGRGIPEMSNSELFREDPSLAWGFIATRLKLYRSSAPHKGYLLLRKWSDAMECGYFVFTSNVDRHFIRAGFAPDRVVERHGSLEFLQCQDARQSSEVLSTPSDFDIRLDPDSLRAFPPFPSVLVQRSTENCQHPPLLATKIVIKHKSDATVRNFAECQHCVSTTLPARPNIRLFNDDHWISEHILDMEGKFHRFVKDNLACRLKKFVVIEIGVGVTVDTVRPTTDKLAENYKDLCTLVRINPIEPEVPDNRKHISLRMTALEALEQIDKYINEANLIPGTS